MAKCNGKGGQPPPALPPRPFSLLDHLLYAASWLGFAVVLGLSAWLTPSPSGVGTHTALHLPPCTFYTVFHKPCPSCGMTTAFAWLLHGHPLRAIEAQPAGVAVFLAAFAYWLYLPLAWRRRRPFDHLFDLRATLPVLLALILLILGVWAFRMAG